MDFTASELRVLQYLDQRGPTHRQTLAADVANLRKAKHWPQALTMIAGKMTYRLRREHLISEVCDGRGFHKAYQILDVAKTKTVLKMLNAGETKADTARAVKCSVTTINNYFEFAGRPQRWRTKVRK